MKTIRLTDDQHELVFKLVERELERAMTGIIIEYEDQIAQVLNALATSAIYPGDVVNYRRYNETGAVTGVHKGRVISIDVSEFAEIEIIPDAPTVTQTTAFEDITR